MSTISGMQEAGSAGPRRGPAGRARRNRHPEVPPPARPAPGPLARGVVRVVVRAADAATHLVTALVGASPTAGREHISQAELRDLVAANTVIDPVERRIIDEVLVAGASLVREVMMPRTEVVFLDAGLPLDRAATTVRAQPHTRYPVIDGTHDDVVGFVHLHDLLIRPEGDARTSVGELVREVKTLPASKRVLAALSEMRREGHHLAVVVDEYGGTAGIVTLEDLVEELVGEIHEGYDDLPGAALAGLPAEVDGLLNLADFAERTGIPLPSGPYETVGGFVMAALGRLPAVDDEVRVPVPAPAGDRGGTALRLRVLALDGRRVARVRAVSTALAGATAGAPAAAVAGGPAAAVAGAPAAAVAGGPAAAVAGGPAAAVATGSRAPAIAHADPP